MFNDITSWERSAKYLFEMIGYVKVTGVNIRSERGVNGEYIFEFYFRYMERMVFDVSTNVSTATVASDHFKNKETGIRMVFTEELVYGVARDSRSLTGIATNFFNTHIHPLLTDEITFFFKHRRATPIKKKERKANKKIRRIRL